MTQLEYQYLQDDMTRLIKTTPFLSRVQTQGFEDGVLACKSIISAFAPKKTGVDCAMTIKEKQEIREAFDHLLDKTSFKVRRLKEREAYDNSVHECRELSH